MKKTIPLLLLALLLVLAGVRVTQHLRKGGEGPGGGFQRPPVAVEIAEVTHGPIREIRLFTGSVLPQYRYLLATKVPGRVVELGKRIGDRVRRGELVARLDDAEYQQQLREARANLDIARASLVEATAQLDLAQKDLDRIRSLRERNLVPSSDLDTAESAYDAQQARLKLTEAQVQQREAALEAQRIRLDYTLLRAAEAGYVGERLVDEGALLPANAAVISVVGLDTVFVRTTVIERDYARIRSGQEARIEVDAFPGRSFVGRVSRLAPVLSEASRVAEMEVVVPNPDQALKPGMFTRVHVVLSEKDDAQIVPVAAVVRRNETDGVFLADTEARVAHWVPVTLGISAPPVVEVTAPELGQPVVTLGQHLLEDGAPILVAGDEESR